MVVETVTIRITVLHITALETRHNTWQQSLASHMEDLLTRSPSMQTERTLPPRPYGQPTGLAFRAGSPKTEMDLILEKSASGSR